MSNENRNGGNSLNHSEDFKKHDDGSAGLSPITTISDFSGSSPSFSAEDVVAVIKKQRTKDLQEDTESRGVVTEKVDTAESLALYLRGLQRGVAPLTRFEHHQQLPQQQHQHQSLFLMRNNFTESAANEVPSVPYPTPLMHSLLSASLSSSSSSSSHFGLLPTSPLTAKTAAATTGFGHTPATETDCRREVANNTNAAGNVWPSGVVAQQQMELLLRQLATTQTLLLNNNNNRCGSDQNSKAVNENDRRNQIACADQHQTQSEEVWRHHPTTMFQTSTTATITRPIANDVDDDDTELIAFSKRQHHREQLEALIQSLEHFNGGDVPDASLSANEESRMMNSDNPDSLDCYGNLHDFKNSLGWSTAGEALDSEGILLAAISERHQHQRHVEPLSIFPQKHQEEHQHHHHQQLFSSPMLLSHLQQRQYRPADQQHKSSSSGSSYGSSIISPASEASSNSLQLEGDEHEEHSLTFSQNSDDNKTCVVAINKEVKNRDDEKISTLQQQKPQLPTEDSSRQQQESPAPQYFSLLSLPSLLSKPPATTFQPSALSAANRDTMMDSSMVPHGSSSSSVDNNTGTFIFPKKEDNVNDSQPQLELQRPPPEALKTAVPTIATTRKKKKPYKELTLEEKVELIRLAERCANLSQASIAERYAIAKSNVCRILQRKDEYLQAFQQSGCVAGSRKRKLRSLISDNSSSSNIPGINNNIRETDEVVDETAAGRRQTTVIATRFGDNLKPDELMMMKEVAKNGVTKKAIGGDNTNNHQKEEDSEAVNNDNNENNSNFAKMDAHRLFGASDTLRLHMGAQHDISRLLMCRCCNWAFGDKHSLNTHVKLRKEGSLNAPLRDDGDKARLHNTDTGDNNREHIEGGHQYHHFHRHLSPQQHQHQKRRRHHSLSPPVALDDAEFVNNNDSNNSEEATETTTGLQHSNAAGARKRARGRSSIATTATNNQNNKNNAFPSHYHQQRHFATTKSALSPAPSTKIANNNNSGGISHPIPLKPAAHHPPLLQNPEQQHLHLFNKNQFHQHNPLLLLPQLPLQLGGGPPLFQQERSKHHPLFVTDEFNEKLAGSDVSVLQRLFLLQQQHHQTQQQQKYQMIQNQRFLPVLGGVGRSNGVWLRQQHQLHSQQHQTTFLMKNEQDQEDKKGDVRCSTIARGDNVNDKGTVICRRTSPPRAILQTTSSSSVVVVADDEVHGNNPQQPPEQQQHQHIQRTALDDGDNGATSSTTTNINDDNSNFFAKLIEEKTSQNAVAKAEEKANMFPRRRPVTTTASEASASSPQPATMMMAHYSNSASSCSSSPPASSSSSLSSIISVEASCTASSFTGDGGAEGKWSSTCSASSTTSSSSPEGRGGGATLSSSPSSSSSSSMSSAKEEKPSPLCCCMKRATSNVQINHNNIHIHSEAKEECHQQTNQHQNRQPQQKCISSGGEESHDATSRPTTRTDDTASGGTFLLNNNNHKEVPLGCDQCPVLEERLALSSSRLAYLDLCRLNCQNELLRLSARAALSDQCARKLEIEARQWKERSEMLTIRLLECREKVLTLIGQQKQQQLGGAPSSLWSPAPAEQLVQFQFLAEVLKLTLV